MKINKNYLKQIILEEYRLLEEERVDESFSLKKILPWIVAGAAAITPTTAKARQGDSYSKVYPKSDPSSWKKINGILISPNSLKDIGGEDNINRLRSLMDLAASQIRSYFLSDDVKKKLLNTTGKKQLPLNYKQIIENATNTNGEIKNNAGDLAYVIISPLDSSVAASFQAAYAFKSDVMYFNSQSVKKQGLDYLGSIKHEFHHKLLHKIYNSLGLDISEHHPHKEYTNIIDSTYSKGYMEYVTDFIENSAYSFSLRDAINLSHNVTPEALISAFKDSGIELEKITTNVYGIKGYTHLSLRYQISTLKNKLGASAEGEIFQAILPFKVTIGEDKFNKVEGFDIVKLAQNLSRFAIKTVNNQTKKA